METIQVTRARDFRSSREFTIKVDESLVVRMRRLDMPTMLLNGLLPLPMLAAAQKFESLQAAFNPDVERDPDAATKDTLKMMAELEELGFLDMLRRYASVAVLEPKIVIDDDGDPEHIPVTLLSIDQLLTIWNCGNEKGSALLNKQQAEDFRRPEPDAPGAPGPVVKAVLPEAEHVVYPDRDAIHA